MTNASEFNRTLFVADNLPVLRGIDSESIDLIATDPPFNKGVKAFEGIVAAGLDAEGKAITYKDVWTWGDVQSEWVDSIRQDQPNLYAVIRAANAGGGGKTWARIYAGLAFASWRCTAYSNQRGVCTCT